MAKARGALGAKVEGEGRAAREWQVPVARGDGQALRKSARLRKNARRGRDGGKRRTLGEGEIGVHARPVCRTADDGAQRLWPLGRAASRVTAPRLSLLYPICLGWKSSPNRQARFAEKRREEEPGSGRAWRAGGKGRVRVASASGQCEWRGAESEVGGQRSDRAIKIRRIAHPPSLSPSLSLQRNQIRFRRTAATPRTPRPARNA